MEFPPPYIENLKQNTILTTDIAWATESHLHLLAVVNIAGAKEWIGRCIVIAARIQLSDPI